MIDRYSRPEMSHIFSLENKFALWQEIEVLFAEACAKQGKIGITLEEARWIRQHAGFDLAAIEEIEAVTNHDVIAFLTNLGQHVDAGVSEGDPKPSRWLHYGMTSSDLGDTALCCQITQAVDLILAAVRKLGESCKRRALEEQGTLCVGRTHGIQAEPMTFGMKFGAWAWALKRAEQRLLDARALSAARGALSGAVGSYSSIDPALEAYVCEHLGLTPDPLSTQVIARDNHAHVSAALAGSAATLEQIATEIRALQKSEVLEAEEPFTKGQKGSSAMPHKRNPITCERVCGLARVVKANMQVALDNVALWHERDISHSSAERVVVADSFIALDYMLAKMQWVIDGLVLYPANMLANLERTRGLIYSSKVLLVLVDAGITREEAYAIVQRNALAVWDDIQQAATGLSFRERLEADPDAASLIGPETLDAVFDPWSFLGTTSILFDRLKKLEF
ncbi:MAG: adenylosuccinate lyase [Coriobacteriia bacterium]|nr:adenylosuccinate lyase [Coriobacteriia bacterium]MCL2749488.1 adenylosuccinate lyase [Coriobacteriia bacterium]